MGIFGPSAFDSEVENVTSEKNTEDDWSKIMNICDKVTTPSNAKECLKAIMKRMNNNDPHVVMQAITLLDACVSNCGRNFHLEIASREFENEFRRLLPKVEQVVSAKMRYVLKRWAEGEFKTDAQLNLIPSLYQKLQAEGYEFNNLNEKPSSKATASMAAALKDPNVVSSEKEMADITRAIELSLKETKQSPKTGVGIIAIGGGGASAAAAISSNSSAYPSLYPSFPASGSGTLLNSTATIAEEARKVRALYDFEAVEENELTFYAGEIIHVLDDSDQNWWKGRNQRGEGLFPSNFVSADLSVDPERLDINQHNKSKQVQFDDDVRELQEKTEAAAAAAANQRVEINEGKIDRLLHLLHEANPEDPSQDSDEMLRLEQEVHQMGPLIDAELERVDRKHAQLTQLSSDLVDAINLYHSLMRDDRTALMTANAGVGYMPGFQAANVNTQMLYGAAGYQAQYSTTQQQQPQQLQQQQQQQQLQQPTTDYASLPYVGAQTMHTASAQYAMNGGNAASIPMQFQNGQANPQQLNGVATNGMPNQQLFALPPQLMQQNQTIAQQQQQQHQRQQLPNMMMVPPEQHQHQQQQQHQPFMPQQQFAAPMPNGPMSYGLPAMQSVTAAPQPSHTVVMPQAPVTTALPPNAEHFNQLQQQMAAMSFGMNPQQQQQQQPSAMSSQHNNNIPIYQQQR